MSDLQGQRVLVTGAAGFIGSHLVQQLLRAGAVVRALVHYRADGSLHNLADLAPDELAATEVLRGDISDPYCVRGAVRGCEVVFHLAALIGIPYSYVAPAAYVATNIGGTLNILEACRAEGVRRLVHTSTSECYGTAIYTPIDEVHPLQGQSPYSASKIGADKLAESYYRSFDVPVVTVRPFNTYGPRQSARAVIPTIIGQLLGGAEALRLGDLTPIRDLTFVSDTAAGFVRAALAEGIEGATLNLGCGRGVTIGELAGLIMDLLGRRVPLVSDPQRLRPPKSEVFALISDNRQAAARLGWQPQVALEAGLAETIAFLRAHPTAWRAAEYAV